jgi:ubiquinone/menaquinone biosynthesis C-methylase UbiE
MNLKFNMFNKWEESRTKHFLSLLDFNPDSRVVDLGCGNGNFTYKAKEKIGCKMMLGVDGKEEVLIYARKKGIKTKKCDLENIDIIESNDFDVVISNQVIEHSHYPVKFMNDIYRIVKPGGYAVISTENLSSWDNILALIMGYTPFSMEYDSDLYKIGNPYSLHNAEVKAEKYPHVRILAWHGLIELAKFAGFKILKVAGSGHIFGRFCETLDKKHCRFITIKVKK